MLAWTQYISPPLVHGRFHPPCTHNPRTAPSESHSEIHFQFSSFSRCSTFSSHSTAMETRASAAVVPGYAVVEKANEHAQRLRSKKREDVLQSEFNRANGQCGSGRRHKERTALGTLGNANGASTRVSRPRPLPVLRAPSSFPPSACCCHTPQPQNFPLSAKHRTHARNTHARYHKQRSETFRSATTEFVLRLSTS